MRFVDTCLPGVVDLRPTVHHDRRGQFVKAYHRELFAARRLGTDFAEEYWTVSQARVLRGLHFQLPPHDHAKVVYCVAGKILDAVLDLRAGSPTVGRHALAELSGATGNGVYIPPGLAHGFYVLEAPAIVVYAVTSAYAPDHDAGVRWDSVGIPWPDAEPVLSNRDHGFPTLADFQSPFTFDPDRP
jgi:dTDP-4-dehydrorhamnose 3,5-epimerase